MEDYKESVLWRYPNIITYECTKKLIEQMEKCICKINIGSLQGTGFFTKIPFPDLNNMLPVLFTNNHLISKNLLYKNEGKIRIDIKEEYEIKEINLNNRMKYTNEEYDITIIEIKEKDNIKNYLDLDDIILNGIINQNNKNKEYINETIYIIQYPENKLSVSYGLLNDIYEDEKYNFNHRCSTKEGSSGSPILNLNNKIIGMHKEGNNNKLYNKGLFLNYPIKEFIQNEILLKKSKNYKTNIKNNKINELTEKGVYKELSDTNDKKPIKDNYADYNLIGKPFYNPFKVFIFNKINKSITLKTFDNKQIKSLDLDDFGPSSAYCNGNNHLFISGGETNYNKIIDKFFDINLDSGTIECRYNMIPKKNHSMVFIEPNKIFIIGGNDKKTFYININKKEIINLKDLNIIRLEPALQIVGNILYCFEGYVTFNGPFSLEKIDINNTNAKWELIFPRINQIEFPQKYFAVTTDKARENIIFLGGEIDKSDDNLDSKDFKNYKYNIYSNSIVQTNISYKWISFKEKTFLPYNKNVDFLFPDFNRYQPEITFYVKNKERFEILHYHRKHRKAP